MLSGNKGEQKITMRIITTFSDKNEFKKAKEAIDALGLPCEIINPEPGYKLVGLPALIMDHDPYGKLNRQCGDSVIFSGWVDYNPSGLSVPQNEPKIFSDDIFGECRIFVHAPCVADPKKIRVAAHLSGSLSLVMPYVNAEKKNASFNRKSNMITFTEQGMMIVLYDKKITIAKAGDIVDAWRVLEGLRCLSNDVWGRRELITPFFDARTRPHALEIYGRLPRTNCKLCGELTCFAFAMKLWSSEVKPSSCKAIFGGGYEKLKDAFADICRGLGVEDSE